MTHVVASHEGRAVLLDVDRQSLFSRQQEEVAPSPTLSRLL